MAGLYLWGMTGLVPMSRIVGKLQRLRRATGRGSWLWLVFGFGGTLTAQVLVGGVTENSARLCIWAAEAEVSVAHWVQRRFTSGELPLCLSIDSLQPGTRYAYEVRLPEGRVITGSFHTPPVMPCG